MKKKGVTYVAAVLLCAAGLGLQGLFGIVLPVQASGFNEALGLDDHAQVILQIPYGIKNSGVGNSTGLMVQDSKVASLFIVESYNPTPLDVTLSIRIPKPLVPETGLEGIRIKEDDTCFLLEADFRLVTEFDDWYRVVNLRVPETAAPKEYAIQASACFKGRVNGQPEKFTRDQTALVKVVRPCGLQELLKVESIHIPTSMDGNADEKCARNSLLLRSGLGFWGKILGGLERDEAAPVSFAGIKMTNHAQQDAIVLVDWTVLDIETRNEVPGFRIPQGFLETHGGGEDKVYTQVFIPAKQKVECVLPIFADPQKVLAGHYLGRVGFKLFGCDAVIGIQDFHLTVRKMDWASIGTALYAMVAAIGAGLFLVGRNQTIFKNFKSRWLILIALFGSAKFLVSLVPRFFLNELFNGLLGPFSAFATGFFREGVSNLFIMALVVLIPKPGVVTLSILMSLVLFCLMGGANPVIILFMLVSMSTMEIALYLTGFTREPDSDFSHTSKALILAALGMGTASAFATFVDYNLYMLLYRLYYAKWFIFANILIVGFAYTAIFAPAGVLLGNRLKKVAAQ